MRTEILQCLAGIERDHGVRVLYAAESGSRAWGFASPNSDYDVRFVHVHPREHYKFIAERLEQWRSAGMALEPHIGEEKPLNRLFRRYCV
jgi:hypothetical protein